MRNWWLARVEKAIEDNISKAIAVVGLAIIVGVAAHFGYKINVGPSAPAATQTSSAAPTPIIANAPSRPEPPVATTAPPEGKSPGPVATSPQGQAHVASVQTTPPVDQCGSQRREFITAGPISVSLAECGVITRSSKEGRWGVLVAGWIKNNSTQTTFSTVSENRDGQMGHAGYLYGWNALTSAGGACEVADLANLYLPVSGLYGGLPGESATKFLNGSKAVTDQLAPGQAKRFEAFFFCPNNTIGGMTISPSLRFFTSEDGQGWRKVDFDFENLRITGSTD